MKISRIKIHYHCLLLTVFTVFLAMYKFWPIWHSHTNYFHTVKLSYGPPEQDIPDIWDPPYIAIIQGKGNIQLQGYNHKLPSLPSDLEKWILLQPFTDRGFSLYVMPEATVQDIVDFLDAIKPISDRVQIASQKQFGKAGGTANAHLWYHSNTNTPCLRLPLPPPPAPPASGLTNRSTRTLPLRVTFPAERSDSSSPTAAPLR